MYTDKEIENLKRLLFSEELANVNIGLEIIQQTPSLFSHLQKELFLIWKIEVHEILFDRLEDMIYSFLSKEKIKEYNKPFQLLYFRGQKNKAERLEQCLKDFIETEPIFRTTFKSYPHFHKTISRIARQFIYLGGDLRGAFELYKYNLDYFPSNGYVYYELAYFIQQYWKSLILVFDEKQLERQLLQYHEQSIVLNYNVSKTHYLMGRFFQEIKKDFIKSEYYYGETTRRGGMNAARLHNIGYTYYKEKDFDLAKTCYRKALQIDPNASITLNNLAWVLAKEDQNYVDAFSLVNQALTLQPNHGHALNTKAYILWKGFQKEGEAQVLYQQSWEHHPSEETALALGYFEFHAFKNIHQAIYWYHKALHWGDKKGEVLNKIKSIYQTQINDKEKYLEMLQNIFSNYPDHPFIEKEIKKIKSD